MGEMESFSDWMSNLNEKLTKLPLSQLAIPGSHNAMAYNLDVNSSVLEPKKLKALDTVWFSTFLRPIVKKWGTAQTVSEQLDAGVRYFDMRVAGKPDSSDFFFYHGLYTTMTVKEGITELETWLRQHSKEVVILAFSHFKEMAESQHSDLTSFLKEHFKTKLCPKTQVPSLKDCWENGYQVILFYDNSCVSDDSVLWPQIEYWWADNSDPKEVILYLNRQKQKGRPDGLFIAGINLTFDGNDMLLYLIKSLKEKTTSAYPQLLDWVKEQHQGPDKEGINIIAGDFVGMNSFVQDVIQLNRDDNGS